MGTFTSSPHQPEDDDYYTTPTCIDNKCGLSVALIRHIQFCTCTTILDMHMLNCKIWKIGMDRRKRTCDKCVQAPHIKGSLVGEGWGQSMYDH